MKSLKILLFHLSIQSYLLSGRAFKILTFLFLFNSVQLSAQSNGTLLLIVDVESKVMLDGEEIGKAEPKIPIKFEVSPGEHYLQIFLLADENIEAGQVLTIEEGKQKVLKIDMASKLDVEVNPPNKLTTEAVLVADLDIVVPGLFTMQATEKPEYPTYLYAFEKGDQIVLNMNMRNENGTNVINVSTYPDQSVKYTNDSFQELKEVVINVEERSIYSFTIATNHAFDRNCGLSIGRIPESDETKGFNPTVTWEEVYSVEVIHQPQHFYVNSGSNATFEDGKSRILLPLKFPQNTVVWYYEFSALREEAQVESVSESFSLISGLTELISSAGFGQALNFGINQLTQPPGSDFCDIYLLDHQNSSLFTAKQPFSYYTEATRENYKSGLVQVQCCTDFTSYLGIKNPSNLFGIHVIIEVVAIVKNEGWMMAGQ